MSAADILVSVVCLIVSGAAGGLAICALCACVLSGRISRQEEAAELRAWFEGHH